VPDSALPARFVFSVPSRVRSRSANLVIKRLDATSLENDRSLELAAWLGELLPAATCDGFRLAQPVRASDGRWILGDGWAAWRYVPGRPASTADVIAVIPAIRALHRSLSRVQKHPALDGNTTVWGVAHRHCWGSRPRWIHPVIAPLADELYARLRAYPTS